MLSTMYFFVAQLHSISLIIETYVRHVLIFYNALFVFLKVTKYVSK